MRNWNFRISFTSVIFTVFLLSYSWNINKVKELGTDTILNHLNLISAIFCGFHFVSFDSSLSYFF